MTASVTPPTVSCLKSACEQLTQLNRTVTHAISLASEKELLSEVPHSQHARRPPCPWGHRRDVFFWDAWDRSIRGEDDMHRFFEIAQRIGGHLAGLEATDAAGLIPGTAQQINGSCSNLFLPDYWMFVVHQMGMAGQLPYEWRDNWTCGSCFNDKPYAVVSRLPVNVVQASIDALTVLIDAATPPCWEHDLQPNAMAAEAATGAMLRADPPAAEPRADIGRRPRKRAERATGIEALTEEMRQHVRAARDHLQAAVDFDRDPELLPRPSQKELAKRVGITVTAASRCFNDSSAKELRLLWDVASDLDSLLKHVRVAS
jgi:hypothetical protein